MWKWFVSKLWADQLRKLTSQLEDSQDAVLSLQREFIDHFVLVWFLCCLYLDSFDIAARLKDIWFIEISLQWFSVV